MTNEKNKSDPLAHIEAVTPDAPINILKLAKRAAERLALEQPGRSYDTWAMQIQQVITDLTGER